MLRKIFIALVLSLVGLFGAAGVATAAPGDYGAVTIITNVTIVNIGGIVVIGGTGFTPGETINITIVYSAPSGLRSNNALRLAVRAAAAGQTTVADASGSFSIGVQLTQVGVATITATGETSGTVVSTTVTVLAAGQTTPAGTTTVGASTVTATSEAAGAPTTGNASGGLASTGASIAGPITVGVSALIAGLALLFFGSRLVSRRKQGPSAH